MKQSLAKKPPGGVPKPASASTPGEGASPARRRDAHAAGRKRSPSKRLVPDFLGNLERLTHSEAAAEKVLRELYAAVS